MKNLTLLFVFITLGFLTKASEVFIRMEIPTVYTVTIGDQSITNSTGKFRFFDLPSGNYRVYVFNGMSSNIIASQDVFIANNVRTILFMNAGSVITTQGNYALGVRDWYDTYLLTGTNNGNNGNNGNGNGNGNNGNNQNDVDLNKKFVEFIKYLQDTHTDQKKLDLAKEFVSKSKVSCEHVEIILRTFSFDTYRTQFAIYVSDYLTDPQNYFIWKDSFDFKTNYQKVEQNMKSKK